MAMHGRNTAKVTDAIANALYSFVKLDVQERERVGRHTSTTKIATD
jgi:hypothetical protein